MSSPDIWDELSREQQQMICTWLLSATTKHTPLNNWILFPVVISVVLASLNGAEPTAALLAEAHATFTDYRKYHLDQGWFFDRPHGVDFQVRR